MRVLTSVFALALAAASPALAMTLTSRDLTPNAAMPRAHIYPRCGGENVSPDLAWTAPPPGTRSLVLTMIDRDVKPALWSHWVVVDLPPAAGGLARGGALPAGARPVVSNFGDAAYAGPCPPKGTGKHRYEFTVWAMPAAKTALPPDQNARTLEATLAKTALDRGSLTAIVAAPP